MARAVTNNRKMLNTAIAWTIGLLIFFPILWTILTSFKTEAEAIATPPSFSALIRTVLLSGEYLQAFDSRFTKTCFVRPGSAWI